MCTGGYLSSYFVTGIKDSVENQTSTVLCKLTWGLSYQCCLKILWTMANLWGKASILLPQGVKHQGRCLWSVVTTVLQWIHLLLCLCVVSFPVVCSLATWHVLANKASELRMGSEAGCLCPGTCSPGTQPSPSSQLNPPAYLQLCQRAQVTAAEEPHSQPTGCGKSTHGCFQLWSSGARDN